MPKYSVLLVGTASASIRVEADDPEDAVDEAFNYTPGICAQCSGWGRPYGLETPDEWDVAEYEGKPEVIQIGDDEEVVNGR